MERNNFLLLMVLKFFLQQRATNLHLDLLDIFNLL
jgi:hypothetical protein